jgi:hypothetical protein
MDSDDMVYIQTNKKLRGLSPQENYTDRATVACRPRECQHLWIESVALTAQRILTAVSLDCLDPEPLLFHSSSSSVILTRLWTSVPVPLLLRKSGSAGNRTRDLCICSKKFWPLDHGGGLVYIQSFIKIRSGIQTLLDTNTHTQKGYLISLRSFFDNNKETRQNVNDCNSTWAFPLFLHFRWYNNCVSDWFRK